MSYTVLNLKQDLTGVIHGTTLNKVKNLDQLINRSARTLLLDFDPQETKRLVEFTNPIYTNVFDYALPVDVKGNKVIDIRPQVQRNGRDIYLQSYDQSFDVSKNSIYFAQDQFNIMFNSGVKTIRINAPYISTPVVINQAESIVGNGTWSVGGSASNLTVDNVNYVGGAGSLKFNLAAAGSSGYLENSTMQSLDLEEFVNQASNFLYSYLPTASVFSTIQLRIGSSASNYYVASVSVNQQNNSFINGWNLLAYIWSNMTTVGTPDPSAITYCRVTWNYNGTAQTAVRLNNITTNMGAILEIEYYSKYLFRDAVTGAFQENVTDDSNIINLDTESYNILFDQVAYLTSQQLQGSDALQFDAPFWAQKYKEDKDRYMAMYKSEIQKPQQVYYRKPNPSYSRQWNSWNY